MNCEVVLATVAAVSRSFEFSIGALGAWMAGLSAQAVSLDVPTVTK